MTSTQEKRVWANRIDAYKRSGLSAKVWCESNRVDFYQLRSRLGHYSKYRTDESSQAPGWAEVSVTVSPNLTAGGLAIRIGKAVVEVSRGFDKELFRSVMEVLSSC